jgi:HK97 family phage portal protein
MNWIDKIVNKFKGRSYKLAPTLSGYTPIFGNWSGDVSSDETVQQAIHCIVREMKKLKPQHIKMNGNDPVPLDDEIQKVLMNPNPLMTTSEFIEKTIWLLMLNYNAFIVPVFKSVGGRKIYEALYPVQPSSVDFIDQNGTLYIHFMFNNGYESTLRYDQIIHLRYNFSLNDYMGGDETGNPNNRALLDTIALNDTLLKGVAKAMKASYSINGVVKYNTLIDDGKTEKALAELERKLSNSESGFLPLDLKADFTPMEHKAEIVSEDTLRFADEKILRHFAVPLCILTGDFDKTQYAAFYQSCIEPLVISMSQSFTKGLLSNEQINNGEKIDFYPEDLVFMTVNQVLQMVSLLSNTGSMYENEKRAAFGLRPLPELEGKRYMSLNWIEADMAADYQAYKAVGAGNNTTYGSSEKEPEPNEKEIKE